MACKEPAGKPSMSTEAVLGVIDLVKESGWECNRRVPVRVAGLRTIARGPIRFAHSIKVAVTQ
ncbi:hypothetical protein Sme01_48370 [Sphaerisporangium melleum]|uniref:Uncharacterized protein n=1 Tax=Sphaerisporangium melleum TaxID=321316 RepID=A0A917VJH2_9ACTN|nr:hypothetical protein GCM10007964_32040 [Sphaerisporangium melleum]GII72361.1 hypothetical protein Sme01_48370 [Sphaerisporangium melleum]